MTEAVVGNEHIYFAYDAAGERTLKYSEHSETVYVDRMYQVEPVKEPNLYTKHIFVGETRLVSRVGDEGQAYGGQNGEIYYYHADHLGNTTWVTDNAGAEYEHIEYTPYGESWVDEGRDSLNRINYMFTSKELDAETGLYYFGARYLDPKTSRWMSADPAMGEYLPAAGKGADGLPGMGGVFSPVNLVTYHYGANNPLKYVDPTGEDTCSAIYNKTTETLTVIYVPIDGNGVVDCNNIKTYSWTATNNPQPRANPTDITIPTGENYFPQSFPEGTWNVSCSQRRDNNAFGPLFIPTNAQQSVTTYTEINGVWVATGTTIDTGYGVHGGGYTTTLQPVSSANYPTGSGYINSPQGNNRVDDNTLGCIRTSNEDVIDYAKLSDEALKSSGGRSRITVISGD